MQTYLGKVTSKSSVYSNVKTKEIVPESFIPIKQKCYRETEQANRSVFFQDPFLAR